MVHTLPDGTTKYRMVTVFGQIDTGELAARLNSIVTHDRRGNVVWMDDFEAPTLKWKTSTPNTGDEVALYITSTKTGSIAAKLTTGDQIDDVVSMYKYFQRPVMKRLGFEFSTTINANTKFVTGIIWVQYGSKLYYGTIYLDVQNSKVWYADVGGTPVELDSDYGFVTDDKAWYTLKIVIDSELKEYVRVILNGKTYPMPGIKLHTNSGTALWFLAVQIDHVTATTANNAIYVDNVIITQDEP